ncbi:hypothetical protein SDC9_56548 [bioreactor metagenome]|uniref:Pyridoxamine 5'-phosphate oxidase putative domain-containing protein n=1 Tax=bioreactor metagenome TaxID=1076179 RepID=A0A644X252_9ZZZZ
MIRKDREVANLDGIVEIVDKCKVMRLAMADEGAPYIVPLNFGYRREGNTLELYFHCANRGRKLDLLSRNPKVGFELDCGHRLVPDDTACKNSFFYESVIGVGVVTFFEEASAKVTALNVIMEHQTGKTFDIPEKAVGGVKIGKILVTSVCGKAYQPK